jgi:hypothetical protein
MDEYIIQTFDMMKTLFLEYCTMVIFGVIGWMVCAVLILNVVIGIVGFLSLLKV